MSVPRYARETVRHARRCSFYKIYGVQALKVTEVIGETTFTSSFNPSANLVKTRSHPINTTNFKTQPKGNGKQKGKGSEEALAA